MIYHPVVDRFAIPISLDPWSAALFVAAFVAAAVLTSRRPAYGLCGLIAVTPFALYREVAGTTVTLPKAVLLGVLIGLATYPGWIRQLRSGRCRCCSELSESTSRSRRCRERARPIRARRRAKRSSSLNTRRSWSPRTSAIVSIPDDSAVAGAVAVAAIAVAVTALAQEITGAPSGLYVGKAIVPRIAGVLEGPNQLAGYFQVAIATLGAWAMAKRSALVDAGLALATCADVLTFSRAGLFGLAVVGAVLVVAGGRPALRSLRAAYYGLAAGLAVVGWWSIYAHTVNVLRVSLEESAYAGGVGDRGELWRAAWRMWRDRPLLGVGAGNYELELPAYGAPGLRTHANSWFLQSLAEGGIALFAATVALIAAILSTFARRLNGRFAVGIGGVCRQRRPGRASSRRLSRLLSEGRRPVVAVDRNRSRNDRAGACASRLRCVILSGARERVACRTRDSGGVPGRGSCHAAAFAARACAHRLRFSATDPGRHQLECVWGGRAAASSWPHSPPRPRRTHAFAGSWLPTLVCDPHSRSPPSLRCRWRARGGCRYRSRATCTRMRRTANSHAWEPTLTPTGCFRAGTPSSTPPWCSGETRRPPACTARSSSGWPPLSSARRRTSERPLHSTGCARSRRVR